MVCHRLPAHCFLQVVECRRELSIAAGSNYQRFDRMLRGVAGATLERGGGHLGRPWGERAGVFESPVEIALVGNERVCNLLIFRQAHDDVGRNTLTLYRTPWWGKVKSCGQPQRALPFQWNYRLHRALAEAPR